VSLKAKSQATFISGEGLRSSASNGAAGPAEISTFQPCWMRIPGEPDFAVRNLGHCQRS
jgi:hypothetical protein